MTSVGDTSATFCAALVDEWLRGGITQAVVAPGSRSTPLAVALLQRSEMQVHLFHDERSAAFAALGIALATGMPSILLCTSGTAATHFHGAVAEADLSCVPMIVCTADRPPELKDVGAPQTIDQTNLYGHAARWFHDPGVPAVEASHTWRSLAARAHAISVSPLPGPVHLNLPFREPLLGTVTNMPAPRDGAWWTQKSSHGVDEDAASAVIQTLSGRRGIVVAGRGATPEVLSLATSLGWPVFADSRSGLRNGDAHVVMAFDAILRNEKCAQELQPEVVLRVGEPPASKVLSQWIAASPALVVQFLPHHVVSNPEHQIALTLVGYVSAICSAVSKDVKSADSSWLTSWSEREKAAQKCIDEWTSRGLSEPGVARAVTGMCVAGSQLVVSSSMPIRDVEWFGGITADVDVMSNRGANGIDGVISTAVGAALATKKSTTVLIGDIACIHDSNGLWGLSSRDVEVKVVVTNNDGGSIFSFLPQASALADEAFEFLYGTPHGVSFAGLAAAHNLPFVRVTEISELKKALAESGSRVIEVSLDRSINVAQHQELNNAIIEALNE